MIEEAEQVPPSDLEGRNSGKTLMETEVSANKILNNKKR